MRTLLAMMALVAFAFVAPANQAGQDGLKGNWRITFVDGDEIITFWQLKIDSKDGKLSATIEAAPQAPAATVKSIDLKNETLAMVLELGGRPMRFNFKAPKTIGKRLIGTMSFESDSLPAALEFTTDANAKGVEAVTTLKLPKEEFKELKAEVAKHIDDLTMFTLAQAMTVVAVREKVAANELKNALSPVLKAADSYGDWSREFFLRLARATAGKEGYSAIGGDLAQQALKEFGDKAEPSVQLRCLDLIALSLSKQDKKEELAKVRSRIAAMEVKGHEENEKTGLGFTPAKFEGRKGERTVLVELFTGAQCPPCVAADLGFEGLGKTYTPAEVVLLQYHLHIPGPDPMVSPDTEDRAKYYEKEVRGTPSIFFNGKSAPGGGGPRAAASEKYKEYRGVVDPLLNEGNKLSIAVDAKRTNEDVAVTATASGYKADDKLKLRLALVEPWVRYAGSNGLSYHAHVVRAMPGGPAGLALGKDNLQSSVKIDLAQLRQTISKNLDDIPYLDGARPFSYRNLQVVAFIQNDDTKEVLHAVQVPVK